MWNEGEMPLRLPGARSLVDSDACDTDDTLVHEGVGEALEKDVLGEHEDLVLAFASCSIGVGSEDR